MRPTTAGHGVSVWSASKRLRVLGVGLIAAALGVLLFVMPWGGAVEQRFGLPWLFQLRGAVTPPEDVVLISIDKPSSDALGVPYDTSRWPRDLHTRLVRGLNAAGARSVTFDLLFRRSREYEDPAFATALRAAGNVALLEFLEKEQPVELAQANTLMPVVVQQRSRPTAVIADAAGGTGPFTLPKVPDQVSRFWTFDENAGSAASLPLVSLALYAEPEWRALRATRPNGADFEAGTLSELLGASPPVRVAELVKSHARAGDGYGGDTELPPSLSALVSALQPPTSRNVNFFGPAQTIETLGYAEALRVLEHGGGEQVFSGKAVFVGVSSPVQWQQRDEFRTAFSDSSSGMDLSGSEILATAFANLRDGNSLRPVGFAQGVLLMSAWAMIIAMAVWMLRPPWSIVVSVALAMGYLAGASWLFGERNVWLPIVIPLLVVAPLLLATAILWQHRDARRELTQIRQAFGRYLPESTVRRLASQGYRALEERRTLYGVCLITDAQGYTSIAEAIPSAELVDVINDYLEVVITRIRQNGGEVSDIKGDSVMAFWASHEDELAMRTSACRALIAIQADIDAWNDVNRFGVRLPTRIGLHCGAMTLARVGAADHFEQRAVGDIVNTSSRLEQLSKELGTRSLLSSDVARGVDGLLTRKLGSFALRGRTTSIDVCEVLGWGRGAREEWAEALDVFDRAREAFEQQRWDEAQRGFQQVVELRDGDQVSSQFLRRIVERS